jgi:hypothetical protein
MEPKDVTFESVWAMIHETNQEIKDLKESQAETFRQMRETQADLVKSIKHLNKETDGIGRSNGAFAEEYFYSSLERGELDFFGEKFDDIEKNLKGIEPGYKAEYDIVLFNCKSIGIVEVKYKGRKENIPEVIRKAETFRVNFSKYANHKIYLAMSAMSFEDNVEKECAQAGIAVIKQVGGEIEINDEHIKVF